MDRQREHEISCKLRINRLWDHVSLQFKVNVTDQPDEVREGIFRLQKAMEDGKSVEIFFRIPSEDDKKSESA